MSNIRQWLSNKASTEWSLYLKRLSSNDTGASGGHQVGVYIPKLVIDNLFPNLNRVDVLNPDHNLQAITASHEFAEQTVRAIYYNNKLFDGSGTRNEKRITRWGGKGSPLQQYENTGALALFAFKTSAQGCNCTELEVWVCDSVEDEDLIESMCGEILPGNWLFDSGEAVLGGFSAGYNWTKNDYPIPEDWNISFPSGSALIEYLPEVFSFKSDTSDKLLLDLREAEYSLFRRVEEMHVIDKVKAGFSSVDEFIKVANSISNRRKSRSGRSLEIHLEHIFISQELTCFATQAVTEGKKKPDFLFPSEEAYHNASYSEIDLRMLAVKTTCKDRWRQVINEADRISPIHLFTLQEGVSVNQFREMQSSNVKLVVPSPLHTKYHKDIRNELMSLTDFIEETKNIYREK